MSFNPEQFIKTRGPWHFIPDWDDLVDPDFDFKTETQYNKGWEKQSYAHELISPPPYDGILVSKVVEEKSVARRKRIRALGVKGALRVPQDFPVLGDCGAFGYIDEKIPPYSSADVFDYYTAGGFDFGVSVDHLIPSPEFSDREFRLKITIENAAEFIKIHTREKPRWIAVGAVQGWNTESYGECAAKLVKMGYTYLAVGGLVRTKNDEVRKIVSEVRKAAPLVPLHLFGVARPQLFDLFPDYGVFSVDSASALRRAWMGSTDNYHTSDGSYCAVRVPSPGGRGPLKNLAGSELSSATKLESKVLDELMKYGEYKSDISTLENLLEEYEGLYVQKGKSRLEGYLKTLKDRPWEKCMCPICKSSGIQTLIFRGNNRNRRRGFHNTWVLQQKFIAMREKYANQEN
ncbi:MAG: queuine/other tRNA-ribosyltransferase [Deltaproteobacteria bacterium]|nr:queuine/other tRNA-ribosyltransferase [Deltaproteobacteria bacterium]